jgi:hypothetical protein
VVFLYKVLSIILVSASILRAQPAVDTMASLTVQPLATAFTAEDRFKWVVLATVGPKNLAAGVVVAGIQTWRNDPEEYAPHWDGFAKRYGARLAIGGTINAMEAGVGALWGEDPRYFRAAGQPFKRRVGHIFKMAFVARNRAGKVHPAYARFIAVPSGLIVSNTWRPDSPMTVGHVSWQIGISFLNRIVSNAFSEFVPDITERRKRNSSPNGERP